MCGGKPSVDTSYQKQMMEDAKKAREEEEARAERIRTGTAKIDANFGQFDDNFFGGYRDKYTAFYQPELDRQFSDAQDQLTYSLARAGTLNSTMAGERQGRLKSAYDTERASLLSKAEGAASDLRGQVQQEKSSLVSLLNATGDANRASNEALSRSQQLFRAQPQFSALPDLFAGLAAGVGNYYGGMNNRQAYDAYFGGRAPGAGTGRVVNG